jgi:hypothetical protein
MTKIALATKTNFEEAVEKEDWTTAFSLAKEIAVQFSDNKEMVDWVCNMIAWQWGDEGRAKANALFISPRIQPRIESQVRLQSPKQASSAPLPEKKPPPPPSRHDDREWLAKQGFEFDYKPPYKASKTLANAMLAVRLQGYVCSYNEFTGKYLVLDAKNVERQLSDELVVMIRNAVLAEFGFDAGKSNIYDAMESLCLLKRVNPVADWLKSLKWDGIPRLDSWLTCFAGAEDSSLNQAFARKTICALVRRAFNPGCKFDHVLVLEGEEEIGKSSLIKAIVGGPGKEYFSDETILDKPTREQQELTKGKWGYELSELSGLRKAETEKVKSFISREQDEARPAYGRYRVEQPRSCVFFGTTNELDQYLMSQTGNRRWWPVRCEGVIDVAGFIEAREQLFAEAVALEPQEDLFIGMELRLEVRALQESRRTKDAWEETLSDSVGSDALAFRHELRVKNGAVLNQPAWVSDEWRVHTNYIFEEILKMPKGSLNDAHAKRLPRVMRNLGWTKSSGNIRIGKVSRPGYVFKIPQLESTSHE